MILLHHHALPADGCWRGITLIALLLSLAAIFPSAAEEVHDEARAARATRVPVVVGVAEFAVLGSHLRLLLLLRSAVEGFGLVETAGFKVRLLVP